MIEELRISGLGVIDDAVLEFAPGFTAVTGETGAGKTMVVSGLGLLFGGRAESGLVRTGAKRAAVDGRIHVAPAGAVAHQLDELGADVDDGTLVLSRVVGADGRSRAHVGGRPVPIGTLAELADNLVAVHGQADQLRLLTPARQRDALDTFGGEQLRPALDSYRAVHHRHRELTRTLAELTAGARERAREADALRYGIAEVRAAAPEPGEDTVLAAEVGRLAHAEALTGAAASAHAALLGDPAADDLPDAMALVTGARAALLRVVEHDPQLDGLAGQLADAGYLISDVAGALASYAQGIEADPSRLAAAQERQAVLAGLAKKYGADDATGANGVLAWAAQAAARLATLEGDDDRIGELTAKLDGVDGELAAAAAELSAARRRAAKQFAAAVTAELHELAMPHASLDVEVRSGDGYGPDGADDVELLLRPHPGAPARPLAKGASGGELSRVMLAVEVVFAGVDSAPTYVFDEVDAGVGGRAAVEVGRRLARLARRAQVLVVTHLPQVAAFADRQLVVVKSDDGLVTRSGVSPLDDEGRVAELARMLAGLDSSELAHGHAAELLETAAAFKSALGA
jgi:DNA repair protein RecN (Recombination protein N)